MALRLAVGLFAPSLDAPTPAPPLTPATAVLEWTGPEQCPDRDALLHEIDGLLEIPLTRETTDYRFQLAIEAKDSAFHARLELQSPDGQSERVLSHEDCGQLSRGVALVIALAVTERREAVAAEPEPELDPEPEPAPEPDPDPEPNPEPEPEPSQDGPPTEPPRIRALISPRVAVATGVLPGAGFDLDVAAGVAVGPGRVSAGIGYSVPRTTPVGDGAEARMQRWSIAVRGGYGWLWGNVGLRLELGAEAGQLLADAPALIDSTPVTATWAAALASPTFVARLHPNVRLDLGVEVPIALRRPEFTVDGNTVVHRPGPVGVRACLGFTFEFFRMDPEGAGHP